MNCDCVNPNKCMICFMENYKIIEKYCGVSKSDAWEGIALERELMIEDELDEQDIPDEIYNLKDSWI